MTIVFQREETAAVKLATLPPAFHTLAPQAHHYILACAVLPEDVSITSQLNHLVATYLLVLLV